MSKMACHCGGVISDTLVPCPTEGCILRDQDQEAFYDGACRDIMAFFRAIQAGRREQWIAEFFSPHYPTDISDESIVHDIIRCEKREVFLTVAECEQCGRLWVQRDLGANSYRSYAPDEPGYAAVLRSRAARPAEPSAAPDPAGMSAFPGS
jgi:hypothetical protein